jgi:hypothetical protein
MKKLRHSCILLSFLLSIFFAFQVGINAQAAAQKPKALMRYRGSYTTIETIIPANQKAGTTSGVTIYKSIKKVANSIAKKDDVPECSGPLVPNEICSDLPSTGHLRFTYVFPGVSEDADKYSVAVRFTDEVQGEIDQLIPVTMDFEEIKPEIQRFDKQKKFYTKNGFERLSSNPNGVIKISITFPAPNDPPSKEFDEYTEDRINRIYDWLEKQQGTPGSIAKVRVEPRTESVPNNIPYDYHVEAFAYDPYNRDDAKTRRRINIFLVTDEDFPSVDFDLEVTLQSSPDQSAYQKRQVPKEISGPIAKTMSAIASMTAPDASKAGDDTTLELREIKSNLDASIALTSAIKDKEENGVTTRKRDTNAVFDLLFAPALNLSLDSDEVHFFTPFFIDAKVSNGSITKDTLSLNRILLGTQYSIRWRPDDGNFNKYIFSFRGINASDRDFKHVEAKFNFEFRPIFRSWNQPLNIRFRQPMPPSVLIPDNGPKYLRVGNFGYQIQPLIGLELGRTYRSKREAFDVEETSPNLRRLFFGMDMVFNVTRFSNIKITDTFYLRGESKEARHRNYFKGELEIPVIFSNRTAQSVFVSFEKGDQPPFVSPGVNAVKIGYRITSNLGWH